MMNVGRGKLRWMTTKGLREMRTMFRAKPRDSTNAMASRISNLLARMASIKQR